MKWPVDLQPPLDDMFSAIHVSRHGDRQILGMSFLKELKCVVFDFTKGKERIGFSSWEKLEGMGEQVEEGWRERWLQFIVGAGIALGGTVGWKWHSARKSDSNKEE